MVFADPLNRATSPIVFEQIASLPFEDSHVRQISHDTTKSIRLPLLAPEIIVQSPTTQICSAHEEVNDTAQLVDESRPMDHTRQGTIDDTIRQRYSAHYNSSVRSSVISATTNDDSAGRLEDYGDIPIDKIDRYGFYPEKQQRRVSAATLDAARARSQTLRRKNTLARDTLKRASMNLGITIPTDYMELPRHDAVSTEKEVERSQKWRSMAVRKNPSSPFMFKVNAKLVNRVYKGIPDCWRSSAWHSFVSRTSTVTEWEFLRMYEQHSELPCEQDGQIDLDVPRTISGHVLFRRRHEGGQRLLFRVLHAIALQFPETGYVQGMASIAATLLCYFPEDQAFVMLARLWTNRGLTALYEPGFPRLIDAFAALEVQMKTSQVGRHLLKIGCQPMAWATRWYLTLFHISLPFRTQLRVWDLYMLYNPKELGDQFKVLEATTLALIEGIENVLLGSDFEEAMRILTSPVEVRNDDRLMQAIRRKMR